MNGSSNEHSFQYFYGTIHEFNEKHSFPANLEIENNLKVCLPRTSDSDVQRMILLAPKQVNTYFNLTTEREQDGNVFDHTNEDSSMGIPLEEPEIHMPVEVIIEMVKLN